MLRLPCRALLVIAAIAAASPAASEPPRPALKVVPNPAPTAAPPVQPTPAQPVIVLDRFAHARANLAALLEGRLLVSELAPLELQDVLDLARNLRGNRPDTRTPSQQCVDDEVRRNGGRPSRLAWEVIALKCREIGEGYAR